MKILTGRTSCEVVFDEKDTAYNHRTLLILGEGNSNNEFCIYRPLKMCWVLETKDEPKKGKCIWVDEEDKKSLISYVIEEAKKLGYSLLLW